MDINDAMEAEKTRLTKLIEDLEQNKELIMQQIRAAHAELLAIRAYMDTKIKGVQTRAEKKTRAPRSGTSVKQQVLDAIKAHQHSITKQTIIEMMNAADNKSLQNGISNALVQLKKSGAIASGDRGSYKMAEHTDMK